MDLRLLKPGHKVQTRDGRSAKVLSETEDGQRIKVGYLDDNDRYSGTEDLVHGDEIKVLLGMAHEDTWSGEVTVFVHHRPEDEDFEGVYEAITMVGIPFNVTVTGSDEDSAEVALDHLLKGLRAFGYIGRVLVEDATESGPIKRYELTIT